MPKAIRLFKTVVVFLLSTTLYANSDISTKTQIKLIVPSGVTSDLSRLYLDIIKNFEKKHPNINVEFHPQNSYEDAQDTVLHFTNQHKSAGVSIVELSQLPTLIKSNSIIAFDKFLKSDKSFINRFIPKFLSNSYGNDKKVYGLPIFRSTPIIYYNMDRLHKIGISKANLPQTWQALKSMLHKIKNMTGKAPLLLASEWYDWLFESFVVQSQGSLNGLDYGNVDFNSSAAIEALSFWKELKDEGLMVRRKGSWKSAINLIAHGKYPVTYYSTAGMGKLLEENKIDWTTDIMPKNRVYAASVGAASIFLSNYMSPDEEIASWKLVKFLLSQSQQVKISLASGYFPVIKSAFEHEKVKKRYSLPPFKKAKEQLAFTHPKIMVPHYSKVRVILKKAIDRSLDEAMDPQKSLTIAQQEVQKWLE